MAYTPDNKGPHNLPTELGSGFQWESPNNVLDDSDEDSQYPVLFVEKNTHGFKVHDSALKVFKRSEPSEPKERPVRAIKEWKPKSTFRVLDLKQFVIKSTSTNISLDVLESVHVGKARKGAKFSAAQEESEGMKALIAAVGKEKAYKYAKLANAFAQTAERDKTLTDAQRRKEYLATNKMDV